MTRKLALVIHFHQPVGNLDGVVQNATDRCYRPFLETLTDHPDLKMTLHYSGCLLEWLEANASDVTDRITALSERGQVELMTGGFYEPILAALPPRDQLGQIRMLTEHLAQNYGADASGLWLTERVWEQEVVGAIAGSGVRYTVVDDTMFHSVGVADDDLTGPFVTDHDGRAVLVYAGDRRLRYLIPYKKLERITDYLQTGPDDRLFVYADDGEKFGEWPDTYQRVYTDGWLASFFEALTAGETEIVTLGEHAAEARPRGRVYLPSSSYDEMMTWALPAAARLTVGKARRDLQKNDPEGLLPFVRGAPWRSFVAKYPEVNQLQKRMLWVSKSLARAGDPPDAIRELYRAQCNCAYWHGAFGGVYLAFMRTALWHHLMRAEALIHTGAGAEIGAPIVADLDADARPEVLLTAPWGAAVVSPEDGVLAELDDWAFGANLLAVTARHEEAYHFAEEDPAEEDPADEDPADENPADEPDEAAEMTASGARAEIIGDALTFDERRLGGLVDLVDGDLLASPYQMTIADRSVVLSARHGDLEIVKTLRATGSGLECVHRLTNGGSMRLRASFASETAAVPLNLGRDTERDQVIESASGWGLSQPEAEVTLAVTVEPMGQVSSEPIETASTSLDGLQKMFQGTIVTTTWALDLGPGETFEVRQTLAARVQEHNIGKKEPGVSV